MGSLRSGRPFAECTTLSFTCLVLVEFAKAFAYRSERISTFHRPFANRWLDLAILWELSLLMLVIYVPFLHHPFRTTGLSRAEWGAALTAALSVFPILEIGKWALRQGLVRGGPLLRRSAGR